MTAICSISDCLKPPHAKGYCRAHYFRFRRHGDPLSGGTSQGEPLRFIHDVALQHTGDECLFWPFGKNRDGYGQLTIDGKKVGAHRYICELAHGAPPTTEHQSAHSCGKGDEGCISQVHLSWKTPIENKADELLHGTRIRGERHVSAKLTEAAAREIINLKSAEPQRKLAERFRVSQMTISRIQSGRKWAHLSPTNTTLDEQERGDAA